MTSKDKPKNFEAALKELEALVEKMESGDETLEESMKNFERGVQLVRECQALLRLAEVRIQKLDRSQDGDKLVEHPSAEQGANE